MILKAANPADRQKILAAVPPAMKAKFMDFM
jgi:hypothetical protein